jgi:hypothetical protein
MGDLRKDLRLMLPHPKQFGEREVR